VYGIDKQNPNAKFAVVCEGVIDALSINGVSILGNRANEIQAQIIDMLGSTVSCSCCITNQFTLPSEWNNNSVIHAPGSTITP